MDVIAHVPGYAKGGFFHFLVLYSTSVVEIKTFGFSSQIDILSQNWDFLVKFFTVHNVHTQFWNYFETFRCNFKEPIFIQFLLKKYQVKIK